MPDDFVHEVQSGAGGYITVTGDLVGVNDTPQRFDISRWELQIDPRLIERTNTTARTKDDGSKATRIGTRYRATVLDPSWKIEFPWDNAATPEFVGLITGSEIDLVLYRGDSLRGYKVYHTTIGPIEVVDDAAKDVVRVVMAGKGGDVTDESDTEIIPNTMND